MARRMFSPKITSTDKFLDMPVSARELYFQLGMNADDDGFLTPKKIMRMIGASDDDLKILAAKGFIIPFQSGVIVITAWKVNNLVRKDWYQETIYKDEKSLLGIDNNGEYKLVNEIVPSSLTQVRLGKISIGKDIYVPSPTQKEEEKEQTQPSVACLCKKNDPLGKKEKEATKREHDAQMRFIFDDLWVRYPKRYGTNSKEAAYRAYKSRMDEKEAIEVLDKGVDNYRAYCESESFVGTKWVMQASKFFGRDKHYLNYQEKQKERTIQDALIERLCGES